MVVLKETHFQHQIPHPVKLHTKWQERRKTFLDMQDLKNLFACVSFLKKLVDDLLQKIERINQKIKCMGKKMGYAARGMWGR